MSELRWRDVDFGDTVEFKNGSQTVTVETGGTAGYVTVLGLPIAHIQGVWALISIKKPNPPIPTHFGARVMYRDRQWSLTYTAMVTTALKDTKHNMIWVEINENQFNWVGHEDIDREKFEVIHDGWRMT